MLSTLRRKPLLILGLGLAALLLLIGLAAGDGKAATVDLSASDGIGKPPVLVRAQDPTAPSACPSAPSGLPNTIERDTFCVYYGSGTTDALATNIADYTDDYWDRFVTDFGFQAPTFSNKMGVRVLDNTGCNGSVSPGTDYLNVWDGCNASSVQMMQNVTGHELFHQVQLMYDFDSLWFHEGTARLIEDLSYADRDDWAGALGAPFSFNLQANTYLASTNNDITSNPMRYNSALWWKYYTEQYGSITTEPQRGIDALLALWQASATSDDIAAVNAALGNLGAGLDFNAAFRNFTVANWTKDLNAVPDAAYLYVDDDPPAPIPYNAITPNNGGTINVGVPAIWNNQGVTRYGARYYQATPGSNCPIISADFHRDSGPDAFYHVVTDQGGIFHTHQEGSGTDWTQSFFNDGITRVVAIVGAQANSAQVDVTLSCADPVIDIQLPNGVAQAFVGPHDAPGKFLVQLLVTNGSSTGPVGAGLQASGFAVEVDGLPATVVSGGFIQEQYWLVVQAPTQSADGTYDLQVNLQDAGGVIAGDTEADSVVYDPELSDHVLVIDRSGSMGADSRLPAAQDAATFYVDITRDDDGLAVVPYNEDVNPPPFAMTPVNSTVRTNAKTYINALSASGLTSIGDGLDEALNQWNTSPTDNVRCSFVLLSDGMENASLFWSDVSGSVIASGCPVTSVAFGPESSETLMQQIATDTGGIYFFSDVFVSSALSPLAPAGSASAQEMALDLSSAYEHAQATREGRERLLQERSQIGRETTPDVYDVYVDESTDEVLFALDWDEEFFADLTLELMRPDGTSVPQPYTFEDKAAGHVGWRIMEPAAGKWQMVVRWNSSEELNVAYQVLASAHTNVLVGLLLPAVQAIVDDPLLTGQKVPIVAHLTGERPLQGAKIVALITAPDGTETELPLFDDGMHGDGEEGDGFYGNWYTLANQANQVEPSGEDPNQPTVPEDEGGYRVRVVAEGTLPDSGDPFRREALGGFAVLESPDLDEDRLPDAWEEEYGVDDPQGDPDLDDLNNFGEHENGTDPLNPDTDGGGEGDGSEVQRGADPLDPADDGIQRPIFIRPIPLNNLVRIIYDIVPNSVGIHLYRATNAGGPWTLLAEVPVNAGAPANGAVESVSSDGTYEDTTVQNGTTYYYRMTAINADGQESGAVGAFGDMDGVTPLADPFPPEANVMINGGAARTSDENVVLSFTPAAEEVEYFDDIAEMKISNDPFLTDAGWQPFAQDVPWTLNAADKGEFTQVYAHFRDENGNESVYTSVATILFDDVTLYLPVVPKAD
jgi:hypothetical protein